MTIKQLDGTYAVVTGASSALVFSMAEALLQEGATVALASRPGTKLDDAVHKLKDKGLKAFKLPLDFR